MRAEIYWIDEVPYGRLGIVGRPRAGDWLHDEVAAWKAEGITDVVSLLEDHEIHDLGLNQEADLVSAAGLSFQRFPIPDRGVPPSRTCAEALWNELADGVRAGGSIAVHCRAGIGRSGLMAAGVLIQLGITADMAWQRISKARGVSVPDTDEQKQWVSAHPRRYRGDSIT